MQSTSVDNILSFYRFARDYPEPPDDLCKLAKRSRLTMLDHELTSITTAAAVTTNNNYCINTEISIWRIGNGLRRVQYSSRVLTGEVSRQIDQMAVVLHHQASRHTQRHHRVSVSYTHLTLPTILLV